MKTIRIKRFSHEKTTPSDSRTNPVYAHIHCECTAHFLHFIHDGRRAGCQQSI